MTIRYTQATRTQNNTQRVRHHLFSRGSITAAEALIVHKITRLAPRIHELRQTGYLIDTVRLRDAEGTPYFRYEFKGHVRFPSALTAKAA